ncbi:MAG: Tryptophan--tRNA ligase, mitochondrial [Phylliscum demangeonii]|nr:MAG: Tryptophan--tRNA ligase, mitochondrial [Phylliscum demangeonii]
MHDPYRPETAGDQLRAEARALLDDATSSSRPGAPFSAGESGPTELIAGPSASSSKAVSIAPDEAGEEEALKIDDEVRLPRSVQAVYLKPLKRRAVHGVPTCDLQLRSYNVRSLEFFADFALRAAYYLRLPALGPTPLPRMVERWTVPRANFVHKKSQENFERITMRRLIQIVDGHPDTVEVWLAYLRKRQYYGVGIKANLWDYEALGVGARMDAEADKVKEKLDPTWEHFGGWEEEERAAAVAAW